MPETRTAPDRWTVGHATAATAAEVCLIFAVSVLALRLLGLPGMLALTVIAWGPGILARLGGRSG